MSDKKNIFPSKTSAGSRDVPGRGTQEGRADFALGWLQLCRDQRLPRLSGKKGICPLLISLLPTESSPRGFIRQSCFLLPESSNLRKHTKSPKKSTVHNSALWQTASEDEQKLSLNKAENTLKRCSQIKASVSADGLMWSTDRYK